MVGTWEVGIPIGDSGPGAGRHSVWLDEPVEERQGPSETEGEGGRKGGMERI